jgi:hypothetical protein
VRGNTLLTVDYFERILGLKYRDNRSKEMPVCAAAQSRVNNRGYVMSEVSDFIFAPVVRPLVARYPECMGGE